MQRIKRDFIAKELSSLALLLALMVPLFAYLVFYADVSPLLFCILPLLAAAFAARMCRQAASSLQGCCGVRSESWQERVEAEYEAAHPICKVAYGELHLMETCLVCRSKRRLLFLPTDEIMGVEERFRLVGAKRVPLLKFTLESGKKLEIDFSVRQPLDGQKALCWLTEQMGAEKVAAGD